MIFRKAEPSVWRAWPGFVTFGREQSERFLASRRRTHLNTNTTPFCSHHKLKINRAADVLQAAHGTLSSHRPAEEQLMRLSKPAVNTESRSAGQTGEPSRAPVMHLHQASLKSTAKV